LSGGIFIAFFVRRFTMVLCGYLQGVIFILVLFLLLWLWLSGGPASSVASLSASACASALC
jgi:hypothetical protein